ncbi:2-aminobenzoate-CoA ligase [Geodermatophilus tzadiensis]|uniref:2-aminobenzoate-CoA ligase n=1 Tax=Geodermatophilus tzadiensis TaxID=1137988 RepID=A0A2T0TWU2_9ACTN|nr:AMP-binding protein [Geodermatophilus tzadiensis]PRY50176.1 2-aminobenzoate-CoA ligase [Geodermatophilus tzadiensis]
MTLSAPSLTPSAHVDTFCRDHLPPPDTWPVLDLGELAYPDRLNCATELLDGTIDRLGADRPCLRTPDGGVWSYGELRARANRIAGALTGELGLVPGNRVLLRGFNSPWLVACWFAVLKAGGVAVTTMPMLRAGELATIGEMCRPTLALCDARLTEDLERAAVPGLTVVPYGGDGPGDLATRAAACPDVFADVPTAADDTALLAFTSGTTGRPKATMHFHRDVLAIADTFSAHVVRPEPDDVFCGSPPIAFTYGLGALVVFPLRAGASVLLLERASPDQLADAVAEHGVTVLSTAPTAYKAILAAGRAPALAGLRRAVSAGETLPAAVWHAVHDATGVKVIDGIGATEMLHVFISAADDDIRPGTTGRAVPGYTAAVLDDDGTELPDGTEGHLAVRGPTGCRYLGGDRQEVYVRHGWNYTGDTYVRDADGYFTYRARTDDMIVSAGYNIAGPEVEQALLGHPEVVECAVVGAPDPDRGTIVKAFVVLNPDRTREVPAEELQEWCRQVIAPYKSPRAIEFRTELPRTSTGKLQRYRLR